MAIETYLLLLILLAVVVYFWRVTVKYVIVGALLALVSIVSYYSTTMLLVSDNIIPMPSFTSSADAAGEVYSSGVFLLMVMYALIAGTLGLLVEMGMKAYTGIQSTGATHAKKKKK